MTTELPSILYQDLAQDHFQFALKLVVDRRIPLCILLCVCGKIETSWKSATTPFQLLPKPLLN
jgi:hypothetical protein